MGAESVKKPATNWMGQEMALPLKFMQNFSMAVSSPVCCDVDGCTCRAVALFGDPNARGWCLCKSHAAEYAPTSEVA